MNSTYTQSHHLRSYSVISTPLYSISPMCMHCYLPLPSTSLIVRCEALWSVALTQISSVHKSKHIHILLFPHTYWCVSVSGLRSFGSFSHVVSCIVTVSCDSFFFVFAFLSSLCVDDVPVFLSHLWYVICTRCGMYDTMRSSQTKTRRTPQNSVAVATRESTPLCLPSSKQQLIRHICKRKQQNQAS